ncbi:MAG: flagellar motor protein MotB [Phycisphaerae bacterium]|nr:flagellar motor protein MotB [Phycisphaerae bacterium]
MSRKQEESSGPSTPAYIVTFSDMVTLLLTFFVLLISLSSIQDPELVNATRDAFINSIQYMGLGLVMGKDLTPNYGKLKTKYFINDPEDVFRLRTIDAKEEDLRRMFEQISQSMTTMRSRLQNDLPEFSVMDIKFSSGSSDIDKAGRDYLKNYAKNLQQNCHAGTIKLYIMATANDVRDRKQQWLLSAKRANAVEQVLQELLPAEFNCPVFSSGAGAGNNLLNTDGSITNSQVFIAVLRPEER